MFVYPILWLDTKYTCRMVEMLSANVASNLVIGESKCGTSGNVTTAATVPASNPLDQMPELPSPTDAPSLPPAAHLPTAVKKAVETSL